MSYSLRNYRHRNPKTGEEKKASTPFFQSQKGASVQKKKKGSFFQPKLAIGQPGDVHEKEADAVASQVAKQDSHPVSGVQPKEEPGVQRLATSKEDEKLGTNDARMEKDKEEPLKPVQKKEGGDEKKKKKPVQKAGDPKKEKKDVQKAGDPKKEKKEKPVQKADDPKKDKKEKPVQKADDPKKEKKEKPVQKEEDPKKEKKEKLIQKKDPPDKDSAGGPSPTAGNACENKDDVPLQKAEDPEKKKKPTGSVQKKPTGSIRKKPETTASAKLSAEIESQSGKGSPLPAKTLAEMNHSFGMDFSNVRIHHDMAAAQLCQELNAMAFTHGHDIYFNEGKFNPESPEGKLLLAHELTHVAQQANTDISPS